MQHLDRNQVRRQPPAPARQQCEQFAAVAAVVKQQARIAAACGAVGFQCCLQPRPGIGHARVSISHGPRWTDCRATAAAHAQMRFDLDPVFLQHTADCAGGTDVDALCAAGDAGAGVGADLLAIDKEFRLFEVSCQLRQPARGQRLLQRIPARREISLRRLFRADVRRVVKIEDEVETVLARRLTAAEVDRLHRAAGADAFAVAFAFLQVNLETEIDGLLGAGIDAGTAAGAGFEVDGVALRPLDRKGAEITGQRADPA